MYSGKIAVPPGGDNLIEIEIKTGPQDRRPLDCADHEFKLIEYLFGFLI
jgi:hypothetical protein